MLLTLLAITILITGGYLLFIELYRHWNLIKIEIDIARSESSIVRPDVRGLLPVLRQDIETNNQAALVLASRYLDAQQPVANTPSSINYSPHMHYSAKGETGQLPEIAEAVTEATSNVLNFQQLFEGGQLPTKGFLVGFDMGSNEPVVANWKNLYSALIGGQPGSGKSTLIRSLLAQAAMQKSKFIVLDPHYGAGEESLGESLRPLHPLLLCDIATTTPQMSQALAYVESIGQRRLAGKDTDKTPVVLVVDETTGLLSRGEIAGDLIRSLGFISQETRKVGVYAFCIGQNFTGKIMPTEVRNSFVSFISCRARRDVARVQSGSNEFGIQAEHLAKGQAVWMTPSGETHRLAIPNCTMEHLEAIAGEIIGESGQNANLTVFQDSKGIPKGFQRDSAPAQITVNGTDLESIAESDRNPNTTPNDARSQRVLSMLLAGIKRADVIKDVWGIERLGRQYQKASAEIDSIVLNHLLVLQGNKG